MDGWKLIIGLKRRAISAEVSLVLSKDIRNLRDENMNNLTSDQVMIRRHY